MRKVALVYDGTLEGFLTCLFTAYEEKLEVQDISPEGEAVGMLFSGMEEVITDFVKSGRVWKALKKKSSEATLKQIKWAFLSEKKGIENTLFLMIQYIFSETNPVDGDYSHPAVLEVAQTARKVSREKHRMEAFVRFRLTKDNIYFAAIEPDFNVLPLIKNHFKNRYADQYWIIYDLKRKFGLHYDLSVVKFISLDLDPSIGISGGSAAYFDEKELEFQRLWKEYFESVNIKSRANSKLHLQHLPKRYWKYLTEKNLLML
ncbi:DNA metabolism protein [Salinimicrobium marinum]|uniref:DNA metabolism protein n=1 Tax=Salinimicrobium marinum TaxID=680283 RepID=A0A918S586_9FLAO|nr:TIGR03915 family putative DNA repair protein [Salinimicrobium marinum]GHA23875.1 DNA metabolism protein [Salinimicrobium marinum]